MQNSWHRYADYLNQSVANCDAEKEINCCIINLFVNPEYSFSINWDEWNSSASRDAPKRI